LRLSNALAGIRNGDHRKRDDHATTTRKTFNFFLMFICCHLAYSPSAQADMNRPECRPIHDQDWAGCTGGSPMFTATVLSMQHFDDNCAIKEYSFRSRYKLLT
jgi:hypothetical protein